MGPVTELAPEFLRATEAAAIAAGHMRGCGDNKAADAAAVAAMREIKGNSSEPAFEHGVGGSVPSFTPVDTGSPTVRESGADLPTFMPVDDDAPTFKAVADEPSFEAVDKDVPVFQPVEDNAPKFKAVKDKKPKFKVLDD